MTLTTGLQLGSAAMATMSALFWALSARRNWRVVAKMPDIPSEGDRLLQLDDGTFMAIDNHSASRMNGWAAAFAAVAALLQAIATISI